MYEFFTDPVLFAPSIGCMLMCLVASLIGTFSVLQRQSLVGETLSHACYPGVILALIGASFLFSIPDDTSLLFFPIIGASISCLVGMYFVSFLQHRCAVSPDAALTLILASFFGIGILLVTSFQTTYPSLYREVQSFLFGQAATMRERHVVIYAVFALIVILALFFLYREIKVVIFDPQFATLTGINVEQVRFLLLLFVVASVVIGIRSVGVVLMSSMLIFPAVSARLWTDRLLHLLTIAAFFGIVSGFFGVYLSHKMSLLWTHDGQFTSFPTGPMIVIVASSLFFFSALFAPRAGVIIRTFRKIRFWIRCQQENFLKMLWKHGELFTQHEMKELFHTNPVSFRFLCIALVHKGWLKRVTKDRYQLTPSGLLWGRKIVRLHRLWEVYLVECCGVGKDRVHPSAEEMEHILTADIERELEVVLHHPVQDPHRQPIPPG